MLRYINLPYPPRNQQAMRTFKDYIYRKKRLNEEGETDFDEDDEEPQELILTKIKGENTYNHQGKTLTLEFHIIDCNTQQPSYDDWIDSIRNFTKAKFQQYIEDFTCMEPTQTLIKIRARVYGGHKLNDTEIRVFTEYQTLRFLI